MPEATIEKSAAIYTRRALPFYDFFVLGFSNHLVWKCPTSRIRDLYNKNVSSNHLDIGVGTGYFLDKCHFPSSDPEITLVDLNSNCLQVTAKRIARYQPETHIANVLERLSLTGKCFDSVGLNYLFHCLPGNFSTRAAVLKNIEPYLNPGATVFGATILGKKANNFLARKLIRFYNAKGIMGNAQDTREDLEAMLDQHYGSWKVWETGMVAFFVARKIF